MFKCGDWITVKSGQNKGKTGIYIRNDYKTNYNNIYKIEIIYEIVMVKLNFYGDDLITWERLKDLKRSVVWCAGVF